MCLTMLKIIPSFCSRVTLSRSKIKYVILILFTIIIVDYFGLLLHFLEVDYSRFSYPLDIPMEETLLSLRKGLPPPHKPINEYKYRYRIRNEAKCQDKLNEYENVVILYVIKSAIPHQMRRDGIRNSWGWENRFSDVIIRRVFMLGVASESAIQDEIDEEYSRYKDIVQADFIDNYYNNTIKTMMAFKWIIQNCPKAQFIVFSDDDMYISTKNLLKFIRNPFNKRVGFRKRRNIKDIASNKTEYKLHLRSQSSSYNPTLSLKSDKRNLFQFDPVLSAFDGRLFAGYVFTSSPMRHKSSKWFISLTEYPYSRYPPYVTAGAFVLSYPALEDMYYTSMFAKHFKFDDVYLGIVAKKCGIVPLHNEHFYFWKKPYTKEAYANVIASHGFGNSEELKNVWEEQRSLGHA